MKLKKGKVYKIISRNLEYGVFTGRGFIGIRTKFGSRYLFEEYEYDTDPHFGTARAIKEVGQIPAEIPIEETIGTKCNKCGKLVHWEESLPPAERWRHDDGTEKCEKAWPVSIENARLFRELDTYKL